ncbi:pentatricopeptide repeat-containing protein At1g02370, mitochondrial-like [Apium graveolens]|uniref:pentatricopeptide repeat-containing protein At1g02370, mitochondrial-like n=1 Tax=Apium graveolens TaxID=4045 RepID=UPI003D7A1640
MRNITTQATMLLRSKTHTTSCNSLCTQAGVTLEIGKKKETLYKRLSAYRETDGNKITDTLDNWVNEGNYVKRFDIVGYVNLLRKFKKYQQANQVYEWLEKTSNKMNNSDRAIRIDLLAKTEGLESAEKYFDNLQGTAKTKKTYGALLNCYCKEKNLEKALNLFERMKELRLSSTLNYNNMMSLYLNLDKPEKVPLLAEEMEGENIIFDLYTYNQIMNSYASLKNFDAVEGVIEKMNKNKVRCDWFTYGNLAKIYTNAGLFEKANATLDNMEKLENLRDREAFHILITLYAQTSNLDGVNRSWDSLKLVYAKPSNVSYLVVLLALSKLGEVDALGSLYRQWESDRSHYDVRVSNVILESYLKRDMTEDAQRIFEDIVQNGAEPNTRTFESFTSYYIKQGNIDMALKYLEMGASKANSMKHKLFPNDKTIIMFLQHFEEENDLDNVKRFCACMKMIDRLDSTVYDSLLSASVSAVK